METLAVTFYDVVVWLHVSAVVVAFGADLRLRHLLRASRARKYPRAMPGDHRGARSDQPLDGHDRRRPDPDHRASTSPRDAWEFSDFFVAWGIVAIIVLLGLVHGFFIPNDTRALAGRQARHRGRRPDRRGRVQRGVHEQLQAERPHGPGRRPDRDPDDLRDGREAVPVGARPASARSATADDAPAHRRPAIRPARGSCLARVTAPRVAADITEERACGADIDRAEARRPRRPRTPRRPSRSSRSRGPSRPSRSRGTSPSSRSRATESSDQSESVESFSWARDRSRRQSRTGDHWRP